MEFRHRRRVELDGNVASSAGARSNLTSTPFKQIRKPRTSGIFTAVHRLDVGLDQRQREELARWISTEYTSEFGAVPLGFVAQCHLGPPYVDHVLDLFSSIVEHYSAADTMPDPFGAARMLARIGDYAFVEVYADGKLCPVRPDGTAVV